MKEKTFKELEPRILARLKELDNQGLFGPNRQLTIMDSFATIPVQENVGAGMSLGRNLPTVVVIDNSTGQMWQFALKILLPDLMD